jgi:beta-galactosidase
LEVSVYSRCEKVRLELNGQVIGIGDVSEATKLKASFRVPYQPGELVAIGLTGDKEVTRQLLKTTGKPYQIRVMAERDSLSVSKDDLAWFNIEIQDENGNLVPDANMPLKFEISGGKLQAVANANPADMHSFQQPEVSTYRGKCQVIVRLENQGEIAVNAMGADLNSGSAKVAIQK